MDAAFLAQALLRAPEALWLPLGDRVRHQLIHALRETRRIRPHYNNWLLFSAAIEAFLHQAGEADWDAMRIDYALKQHESWYAGDGAMETVRPITPTITTAVLYSRCWWTS